MTRMIAGITAQGTAAAETALCTAHDTSENIARFHADDVTHREDCSGNTELSCQVCGIEAPAS